MKIAIIPMFYPPSSGSGPILMEELSSFLAEHGHQVTVITTQPAREECEDATYKKGYFNVKKRDNKKIIRTWTYLTKRGPQRLLSWMHYSINALLAGLWDEKYDLVFLRSPPPTLVLTGYILQALKKIPFILNVQDIHPDLAKRSGILTNPVAIRMAERFEKWAYHQSDSIAVISKGFKQNLMNKGVPPGKIEIIPNWVDTDFITPHPKDNPVSRRLGLSDSFVIMHAGSLTITSYLALSGLLDAIPSVDDGKVEFVFVGEGPGKEKLRRKAEGLSLPNIRFYPFQPYEDLPLLWASADASIVALDPDKSESSVPSKLCNIMATGRPVLGLVNPQSETASIIKDSRCGIVADPRQQTEVKEAVMKLKQDENLRSSLSENGRKTAVQKYSKQVVLDKYEQYFKEVAG